MPAAGSPLDVRVVLLLLAALSGCLAPPAAQEEGCEVLLRFTREREGPDVVFYLVQANASLRVEETRYAITLSGATQAEGVVAELALPNRSPRMHDNGTRRYLDPGDHIIFGTDGLPELLLTRLDGEFVGGTRGCPPA